MLRYSILTIFLGFSLLAGAQDWKVVRENPQKAFPKTVAAGNYSGIAHLHDDIYAVVSDKSDSALYFNFRILVNPKTRTGTGREPGFYRENRWNAERRQALAGAGEGI